jgi:hypothetical protein
MMRVRWWFRVELTAAVVAVLLFAATVVEPTWPRRPSEVRYE